MEAKVDENYRKKREGLIPLAEATANLMEGTCSAVGELEFQSWASRWNRTFLGEMDRLSRSAGLVVWPV